MPYAQVCPRCNRQHSPDSGKRFCDSCGSLLKSKYIEEYEPTQYPIDEERLEIAKYIYTEYESLRNKIGDLELDMLDSLSVNTASQRFNLVFLATLFSGWAMKEERAYSIWKNLTDSFQDKNLCLYEYLINSSGSPSKFLKEEYGVPPKVGSNIWETARNLRRYHGDLNELKVEGNWARTLENVRIQCKGVNQKAFWVARVMRQKKAWDVPGQFCCVSDSHNKAILKKTGFIKSDLDLYHNSLVMWKYFNEPFENKYYDLPVFRFARSHGCKKCGLEKCRGY